MAREQAATARVMTEPGNLRMRLAVLMRGKITSLSLIMAAGVMARMSGLVTAVLLNRWGSEGGISAFYLAFNFGQAFAGFCNLGVSATALATLAQNNERADAREHLPLRLLWHVQPQAITSLVFIAGTLAALGGFKTDGMETLAQGVLAAYGIAYNQLAVGCLLGSRDDRGMAALSFTFALSSYLPVVLCAALGLSRYAGWALAFGTCLPLLIDVADLLFRSRACATIELHRYVSGGRYIVLGNALCSIATLLVIQRVGAALSTEAVVAFGAVQQLRSAMLFAPQQVGPIITRSVTGRLRDGNASRVGIIAWSTAAATMLVMAPLFVALATIPQIVGLLFSGRVAIDSAVVTGLGAACVAGTGATLCRVLEGRRSYSTVFVSNIVFAVAYLVVFYSASATHFSVQCAFLTAVSLQFVFIAGSVARSRSRTLTEV